MNKLSNSLLFSLILFAQLGLANGNDQFLEIKTQINYPFDWKYESEKFEPSFLDIEGTTVRPATVLVNFHEGNELNLSSAFKPGTRTLIWGVPYQFALSQALSTSTHAHEQSALLTAWSKGKLREFLSFVIIPANTKMEFLIGSAAPQTGKRQGSLEIRPGQGTQLRLKYLPAGTIVMTQALANVKKGPKGTINLSGLLKDLINKYNARPGVKKIDEESALNLDLAASPNQFGRYVSYILNDVNYKKYNRRCHLPYSTAELVRCEESLKNKNANQ